MPLRPSKGIRLSLCRVFVVAGLLVLSRFAFAQKSHPGSQPPNRNQQFTTLGAFGGDGLGGEHHESKIDRRHQPY